MQKSIVILLFTLAACSPSITVTTDYDRTANFASYKTYTYTTEALALPIDDLNRRRIFDALDQGMATKGFSKVPAGGDILVDVNLLAKERKEATANTMGGYGGAYPYRWGGGFTTTSINVETYVDGTLIVDFIDANKKQLVWQGRALKTLDPNATPEKREKSIKDAVTQLLAKYPPVIPVKK